MKNSLENVSYFQYFCSKHRLLVHVRGGSNEYPKSMFWSKIRKKIGIPLYRPVLLYKVGFKGIYFSWTCFPDALHICA